MESLENKYGDKNTFFSNISFFGIVSYFVGGALIFTAFEQTKEYINNFRVLVFLIVPFIIVALIGMVILIRISFFKKPYKSILNGLAVFYILPISIFPVLELEIDKVMNSEIQNINARIVNKYLYNRHIYKGGTWKHHVLVFQTESETIKTEEILNSYFDTVSIGSNVNIDIRTGCFGFKQMVSFNSK